MRDQVFMQECVLKQQLMMEKISLITYVFGQSECFLRPRYMKTDSNQLINAGMSKGSWESEILILFPSYMVSPVVAPHHINLMLNRSMS